MRSTDDPDEDSQQGPDHTDARPRADSSAIARCNDAHLRADELERSRQRAMRERLENKKARAEASLRERERLEKQESSTEASPQTAGYKARSTKTDPHPAERRDLAQFKSVGRSRAQCK